MYFYIALVMLVGVTTLTLWLARSKTGAYLQAIRANEEAAETLGVNTFAYKLLAMAVSAFLTAVGGTFYAQYLLALEVNEVFGTQVSVEILLSAIIGGAGTVFGPLVGAATLQLLSEVTRVYVRAFSGFDLMIYGAILIVVIIFLPQGLLQGCAAPTTPSSRGWPRRAGEGPERWRSSSLRASVSRSFGGLRAVNTLNFAVHEGEIVGLIGPNGSGKTTVFNLISGIYRPDAGALSFGGAIPRRPEAPRDLPRGDRADVPNRPAVQQPHRAGERTGRSVPDAGRRRRGDAPGRDSPGKGGPRA